MNIARAQTLEQGELRKARGAYFTPPQVSRFLSDWAIRKSADRIMEPSCGEASFLLSAGQRLQRICKPKRAPSLFDRAHESEQLIGVEIHSDSARAASELLSQSGVGATIHIADFFDLPASADFDAVLGNPPFIRYQSFNGDARSKSLRAALAAGVNLTGLASSWAAFVVHASRFLKPDGRLGMVLPAELLSVQYAAPVRRYLLSRFASIRMVLFERLLFEGALEDVVLLMAEGTGGCPMIEAMQVRDADDLPPGDSVQVATKEFTNDRWIATLVKPESWSIFSEVTASDEFETLKDWGSTYLGAVTGDNDFFCLSDSEVNRWGIPESDLLRISPPGSRHLRELEFGTRAWDQLRDDNRRCWLLYPQIGRQELRASTAAYIAHGETEGVHKAYKCTVRTPWWRVPLVESPDLFLTYMDQERPRFVTNGADAQLLNSLYGVSLRKGRKTIGSKLLPLTTLNTVTLLGAEVHGRSYGGGMLKLEPREADRIPVPSLKSITANRAKLEAIRPHVAKAIERNDLVRALSLVDGALWSNDARSTDVLAKLREARDFLAQRRHSRSRSAANA
jgi:adenine-specific DNA-methyltransferase